MRLIFILGAFIIAASSCRRYETCATYSANDADVKIKTEKSI